MDEQAVTPHRSRRLRLSDLLAPVVALGLLLALIVPIDPTQLPSSIAWEHAAGLANALRFQAGLLLVPFLAYLLVRRLFGRAAIMALVAAWAIVPTLLWAVPDRAPRPGAVPFDILSVNLGASLADDAALLALIQERDPDLLLLLEYTSDRRRAIEATLLERYPHVHARSRADSFGIAVFAKRPWLGAEDFSLGQVGVPQLRLELDLDGRRTAVYGLHLLPPKTSIYSGHRAQYADLLRRIDTETLPCVLAGDFNFVDQGPFGDALHERGFFDAHGIAGAGRGATWPVHGAFQYVPGIRIDHIYVGPGLTAVDSWVGRNIASDHLSVAARLVRGAGTVPAE